MIYQTYSIFSVPKEDSADTTFLTQAEVEVPEATNAWADVGQTVS